MRTEQDGSTRPSHPRNVFAPEYLAWLAERDEPHTAPEADFAGPWHLEPHPQGGWAVLREGESLDFGSTPTAVFAKKEAAQLAAAILPGTGRRLRYRIGTAGLRHVGMRPQMTRTAPLRLWRKLGQIVHVPKKLFCRHEHRRSRVAAA